MKSILSIILLIALVFSLSTCKPAAPSDIFSAAYAKEKNKNTAAMAQAKTFAAKALALHKKKNFIQAEIEWKNALKLYADGEIYYRFGDTLFNLSRFEDAVKAYKNAIELNHPEKKYVYYNMACAYSRMKNRNKGLKYLAIAIQNGYNSYRYIKQDQDITFLIKYINIQEFINENDMLNRELFKAIDEENIDKVKDLIKKGSNVNFVNFVTINFDGNWRFSPLMLASKKGNIKIVELLLNNGADINYSFHDGSPYPVLFSALSIASAYNKIEVIKILIKRGINLKKLGGTVIADRRNKYKSKIKILKLLIEAGADINASVYGTPLINAINDCNIDLINYLFDKGANPNAIEIGCCGGADSSPLMIAVSRRCNKAIDILLEKNVNINYRNQYGGSALLYAISSNNLSLANLLISKGVHVKNQFFSTGFGATSDSILMIAIQDCPAIVKTLIEKGADIHYKKPNCTENCTALQVAKKRGLQNIVKLLIQAGARE